MRSSLPARIPKISTTQNDKRKEAGSRFLCPLPVILVLQGGLEVCGYGYIVCMCDVVAIKWS